MGYVIAIVLIGIALYWLFKLVAWFLTGVVLVLVFVSANGLALLDRLLGGLLLFAPLTSWIVFGAVVGFLVRFAGPEAERYGGRELRNAGIATLVVFVIGTGILGLFGRSSAFAGPLSAGHGHSDPVSEGVGDRSGADHRGLQPAAALAPESHLQDRPANPNRGLQPAAPGGSTTDTAKARRGTLAHPRSRNSERRTAQPGRDRAHGRDSPPARPARPSQASSASSRTDDHPSWPVPSLPAVPPVPPVPPAVETRNRTVPFLAAVPPVPPGPAAVATSKPTSTLPAAVLPYLPSRSGVRAALEAVREDVEWCVGDPTGTITVRVAFAGATGRPVDIDVSGDLSSVQSRCIAAMVRRISLGPFRADGVTVEHAF